MSSIIRCMIIGDLVGRPGRELFQKWARRLQAQHKVDAIVVNGENAADNGRGITSRIVSSLLHCGAHAITTGNHIWAQREIYQNFNEHPQLMRPANFPSSCPGKGHYIFTVNDVRIAVMNLQGRVFMHEHLDCPFRTADSLLTFLQSKADVIIVDMHAETTSEKSCIGAYLDGRVSAVVGTHTHVQTADERILPKGTAFITDLGCCGALNSSLGMTTDVILSRFLNQMPVKFNVELTGPMALHGVVVEIDATTGKARSIERIRVIDEELQAALV